MHFSSITNFFVVALAACAAASPVDLSKRGEIVVGFRRADKVLPCVVLSIYCAQRLLLSFVHPDPS